MIRLNNATSLVLTLTLTAGSGNLSVLEEGSSFFNFQSIEKPKQQEQVCDELLIVADAASECEKKCKGKGGRCEMKCLMDND